MSDSLEQIKQSAREHTRQLAAVNFATVQILAARWGVDEDTVRAIPRDKLPYLEFGQSNRRRYDPRDVERYEQTEKTGAAA